MLHSTSNSSSIHERRYAIGAEPAGDGRMSVRVWAPDRARVAVVVDGLDTTLESGGDGWFASTVAGHAGSRYGFRLDDDPKIYPDPASRFQPDGPHGLSELVDPTSYAWKDERWPGISLKGQTLYELHVGTFSADGTWAAAAAHLDRLAALGITAIQMMPVAEFAGTFGWGYDGVAWFAPTRLYGRPDDLRAFIDAAHARGLAIILDVVYNHLGPDGNYLLSFARDYRSDRYANEWGDALNFDGRHSGPVRELVLANVEHWVREYHVDGFRLDATQQIFDSSPEHLLTALVRRARAAAGTRRVVVIGENESQHAELLRPHDAGGSDLDALYNDDFHHTARVALTGLRESYYADFGGTAQELLSAAKRGFLFQGQIYSWQGKSRGTPALDRPARQFLHFLENHDQVANSADGRRLCELSAPGQLRALTALLLLGPATPLLFQGQEWGSTTPFLYFADHGGDLGRSVRKGRLEFLGQFARFRAPAIVDPSARSDRAIDLRDVQAPPRSGRARRAVLGAAPRSAAAQARRSDDSAAGRWRPRWRDARRAVLRAALFRRQRATTGCSSSTWARTSIWRPAPNRSSLRLPAPRGRCCGRAKIPRMAEAVRRPGRKKAGPSPATLRSC